jgi:hypothetical protein
MPTDFGTLLDLVASTSLSFMTDVITDYWPWILGLVVLVAIARRFKRLVGLAR